MMKITLFENISKEQSVLYPFLLSQGYRVDHCNNIRIDPKSIFDFVIIDIDDFDPNICHALSESKNTHILPILSNHNITALIPCFSSGYHHYIKKPYTIEELKLHINRLYPTSSTINFEPTNRYFFDEHRSTLSYYDKKYIFTKNETSLISLFINRKNQIVPEKEISKHVWGTPHCRSVTIRALITKTQKKLPHRFIKNFRGIGYMWVENTENCKAD